jgi:response regulator NasT
MKVLLADDDAERAGAVAGVLAATPGLVLLRLDPGLSLADAVATLAPDIVLVDMGRPDRDALDSIRQVTALNSGPVVPFADEDDPSFMEEAIGAGVSSYNATGVKPPDIKPILRAAAAMFRRCQQAGDELRDAKARRLAREIIDRPTTILIKQSRSSEPDTYKWLRRTAVSKGRRTVDVAGDVIRGTERTGE